MDSISLIHDLCIISLVSAFLGIVCKRIHLSPIIGFLAAGILLGPHVFSIHLIKEHEYIHTLAQVGLVFLMFTIGLHLSLSKLRLMGPKLLIGTAISALIVLHSVQFCGMLLGWTPLQSLFTAALLMVSSSAVISKTLSSLHLSHDRSGQIALGVSVNEDIVAIIMLAVLTSQVQVQSSALSPSISTLLSSLTVFVVLLIIAGLSLVPQLFRKLEKLIDNELQTLLICGFLFLLAWISVKAGYSLALGAFILGAIVAETPQRVKVEHSFEGLKDLFSGVFFVSIGLMLDLRDLPLAFGTVLLLTAMAVIIRPLATCLGFVLVGTELAVARKTSLLLIPLGEFSFVIAQMGVSSKAMPSSFYSVAIGVSIFTIFLSPIIARFSDPIVGLLNLATPKPVVSAIEKYHAWLNSFSFDKRPTWKILKPQVIRISTEIILCVGLISIAMPMHDFSLPFVPQAFLGFYAIVFSIIYGGIVLLAVVALWRNLDAFMLLISDCMRLSVRIRHYLPKATRALSSIIIFYGLWLVVPPELRIYGAILFLCAALSLILFSRHVIYLYSQWQYSVRSTFIPPIKPPIVTRSIHKKWEIHLADYIIEPGSAWANKTIAELNLPSTLHCTVVELTRQEYHVTPINGSTRLFPFDKITLLGAPADLSIAEEQMTLVAIQDAINPTNEITLESLTLPLQGSWVNKDLKSLELSQKFNVQIVGIEAGDVMSKPNRSTILTPGVTLLILGTHADISAVNSHIQSLS